MRRHEDLNDVNAPERTLHGEGWFTRATRLFKSERGREGERAIKLALPVKRIGYQGGYT